MVDTTDEEAFRRVADNLPTLCWIANADGYITWYNRSWHEYCGTTAAQMEGWGWTEVHDPKILPDVMTRWETSISTGAPFEMTFPLRRFDGRFRRFLTRIRPARSPADGMLRWYGVNIDVEDQLAAETALRDLAASLECQVEERANQLAERTTERDRLWRSSQDLLISLDADGTVKSVSPSSADILGWAPEEMAGKNVLDFIVPDDRPFARNALAVAGTMREAMPVVENRYKHKDGGFRWMSWAAAYEGGLVFATGRHITAKKEAADALRLAQARVRAVFETTALIQGYVAPNGTLLEANPAAMAVIPQTPEQVIGKPFWKTAWFAATPGAPAAIKAGFAAAVSGTTTRQEITLTFPSGERSFDCSMRPATDDAGQLIGVVVEAAETTERRLAEEALRQAQKMQAVGQLTGGIAHDFNNLLIGITGSLERMQTRIAEGRIDEIGRYVTAAQEAARRAAALTHRLLAFSRRQTLDPKPIDVNRLTGEMGDLIRRTAGPAIAVEIVGAVGLWPVLADPNQLENALLNLCINARDAMPDGGRITIETANKWLDDRAAKQRDLPPGQYISLCVTDTGTGMTPEVAARAFDPFFTTKPLGVGTGLGLSMIYGFARQSGGQVRIYSEVGEGTTMCLYLPRFVGKGAAADVVEPAVCAATAHQGETVLVVDDEPTVRMLVVEVLEEAGFTTLEAADGLAGLRIMQSGARIDLLITDVGLPGGMNGRQMADAARTARPDLKVLFITGYAENAVIGNGHLDRGMAILTKPFAMTVLGAKVQEIMAEI